MLALLSLGFVLSFVDRQILSLLTPAIRADLALSDTHMALLHGLAFAIFYTLLGIPLATLADRGHRVPLIVAGMLAWSAATIGCGLATSFGGLFLFRILVGVGEATLNPAAYGMIASRFPAEMRGRAFGIFHIAGSIGAGTALLAGGVLVAAMGEAHAVVLPVVGTVRPWQAVFILCGLPGILLASVIAVALRAPGPVLAARTQGAAVPLGSGLAVLAPLFLASAFFAAFGLGTLAWAPTYFVRTFQWTVPETGLALGVVILVAGAVGPLAGGWIADRQAARGHRPARTIYWLALAAVVPGVLAYVVPLALLSLLLCGLSYGLFTAHIGLVPATIEADVDSAVRARMSATWLCIFNIVGLGGGPLLVALLTTHLFADPARIGLAMAITAALAMGPAILLLRRSQLR